MCSLVKQIKKKGYTPDSRLQSLPHAVVENESQCGILFSSKFFFFLNMSLDITNSDYLLNTILRDYANNKDTWNYFSVSSGIFVYKALC